MATHIDTCGLSCPQPVLLVHQALQKGETALDVLVDNEASRENVSRAAEKSGMQVSQHTTENGVTLLELRK